MLDWLHEHAVEGIFGNIQTKQLCCNFLVRKAMKLLFIEYSYILRCNQQVSLKHW